MVLYVLVFGILTGEFCLVDIWFVFLMGLIVVILFVFIWAFWGFVCCLLLLFCFLFGFVLIVFGLAFVVYCCRLVLQFGISYGIVWNFACLFCVLVFCLF